MLKLRFMRSIDDAMIALPDRVVTWSRCGSGNATQATGRPTAYNVVSMGIGVVIGDRIMLLHTGWQATGSHDGQGCLINASVRVCAYTDK